MSKIKLLVPAACLAVLIFFVMGKLPDCQVVGSDQLAPDFTLMGSDGKEHTLSDYRGKFVVLEWLNYDCPFVKKHYQNGDMQTLQAEYASKGVIWLAINSSASGKQGHLDITTAKKLTQEKGANYKAVLLDPDGVVGTEYQAKTTPHMYIINPKGELIYEGAIDSIKSTDAADVAKATNYVKTVLDAAMAGKPIENSKTQAYGCSVKY